MAREDYGGGYLTALKPKHVQKKFLTPSEKLVFESRQSRWYFMKSATLALIIAIAAIVPLAWKLIQLKLVSGLPDIPYVSSALDGENGLYIELALLAVAVVALFFVYLPRAVRWSGIVYAATDERVIKQEGIIGKTYDDIPVTHIENILLTQTTMDRFLGVGTLTFSTKGLGTGGGPDMKWVAVPNVMGARKTIQEAIERHTPPSYVPREPSAGPVSVRAALGRRGH